MFSRVKETIGKVMIGFGAIWILGAAGADDLATLQNGPTPLWPLLVKVLIGAGIVYAGLVLKGGYEDEGDF